ncbi:MAG: S8 family serine peptidase [candidate division Zixibacteria bacterium]|nr:S8 family serine peptidase [candidate division Zixibacteria bacterium]
MTRKILFLGMILAIIFVYSDTLANDQGYNEVIARLSGDFIKLPKGQTQASIKEVEISSSSLHQLFVDHGVERLAKAYPDFTEKDTVITSAKGLKIQVGDLTKVFLLKFKDQEKADQFLQQVKTPQSLKRLSSLANDLTERKNLAHVDDVRKIVEEINKGPEIQEIIRQHNKYPEISVAEPNYPGQYNSTTPNDPCYPQQWGLHGEPAGISCDIAWDYQREAPSTIAILDRALCPHRDLYFIGDQGGGQYDHGTAVAGIVGALTNNNLDIAGVAWGPLLKSYDIGNASSAEIANGLYRSAGHNIVNISAGSYSESYELGVAMRDVLNGDVLVVCSAGSDNSSAAYYPAYWGFSVGATGDDGQVVNYSNSNPDVVAPGGDGTSDYHDIMTLTTVDPWHKWASGTSMSAPFATGVAGLTYGYMSENFEYVLTRNDMERILEITARDINDPGYDAESGWGRINAGDALKKILKSGPYRLEHHLTASGRDWEEQSGYYNMVFIGVPGLATGVYKVKRYTCYKNVNWQHPCHDVPYVWGNEAYSCGYSAASPNWGKNWCDIVDGSVTTTSATLKTNVYHVWDFENNDCGWHPCQPHQVSFDYSVLGRFNLFTPSISSQLIYDGGTDHYIRITWSDSNEYHDGYQLYLEDDVYAPEIVELPSDCHTYNYHCLWGSSNIYAKVRAVIGDSLFSAWSNLTTTRNAPNRPSDLSVSVKGVCGWPVYAKLTPDAVDNALCDGEVEEYWVSADSSLNLTVAPGHDDDPPPCFPTNEIKVTWDTPENQVGEPDYYKVRLLFYTSPPSVFYVGPVYGHSIEFCTWPNWEQRISVVAYKYGLHSNETEEMKIIKTGSTVICNDYPFGKSSPEGGHETLSDNYNLTPTQFSLFQNYPNPFNPETDISYTLPQDCHVQLTIYNMLGQQVKVLVDEQQIAGFKTVHWDGRDESGNELASGIYFYRLQTGGYSEVRKMILVK